VKLYVRKVDSEREGERYSNNLKNGNIYSKTTPKREREGGEEADGMEVATWEVRGVVPVGRHRREVLGQLKYTSDSTGYTRFTFHIGHLSVGRSSLVSAVWFSLILLPSSFSFLSALRHLSPHSTLSSTSSLSSFLFVSCWYVPLVLVSWPLVACLPEQASLPRIALALAHTLEEAVASFAVLSSNTHFKRQKAS